MCHLRRVRRLDTLILQNLVYFDEDDCRQPAIERAALLAYPSLDASDVADALARLERLGLLSQHPSVFRGQAEVSWRVADFPRAFAALKRWLAEAPRRRLSALAG